MASSRICLEAGAMISLVSGWRFLPFNMGGQGQVFQPAVGAGADEDLLYLRAFEFSGQGGVIDGVRFGHRRLQLIQIDLIVCSYTASGISGQ